jgi:hypothetical protein
MVRDHCSHRGAPPQPVCVLIFFWLAQSPSPCFLFRILFVSHPGLVVVLLVHWDGSCGPPQNETVNHDVVV